MSEAPAQDNRVLDAVAASLMAVVAGMVAQALLAPEEPAWGFYEACGFLIAGVPWLVLGVEWLVDEFRS